MEQTTDARAHVCETTARFFCTTLLAFAASMLANSSVAVEYESRPLGGYITATDINDSGWMVGRNRNDSSAVLLAGRTRTLVRTGTANAINNAGVVVGEQAGSSGKRGFRTTPALSDSIEELGLLPGGTFSVATAINENGTAVGYADNASFIQQAVYFSTGQTVPTSLGHLQHLGGVAAYAYGINDREEIVGAFKKANGKHQPFLYSPSGEAKPLPGFEDVDAKAIAINNTGRIIGNLTTLDGQQRGFIFENGKRTDIEAPAPDAGKNTWVSGLNNSGQVVGGFTCGLQSCPFVFDSNIMVNLVGALPAPYSTSAFSINNQNEIGIDIGGGLYLLSPRRPRPVIQYSGLPLLRIPSAGDAFGSALALHGNVAVISAPRENNGAGAVYVYRYGDVAWSEIQRLVPTNPVAGGRFGTSVAFDGTTIVVGADYSETVAVFQVSGSSWVEKATLSSGSTATTKFGSAVAVKGGRIVVGAPYAVEKTTGYYSGAIYVFDWNNTVWVPTKLTPADLPSTHLYLGTSVQLDGDSVLAGAPSYCWSSCIGAVYLFQHQTNAWTEQKLALPSDYLNTVNFGAQLVVQNDVLAVRNDRYTYSRVTLYRRGTSEENTPWVEQDWVASSGPVAVDSGRIVVTGTDYNKSPPRIFKREGRLWVDAFDVMPENLSASAVALQGSTLLVGSGTGAGVVAPFWLCAEATCSDVPAKELPAIDIAVSIEAPASVLTSAVMTHTLVVKNLHPSATTGRVYTESTFTDSNDITPSWINIPDACQVSASRLRVNCETTGIAPNAAARFELRIAAPTVSGGTFTHNASARYARHDPVPENNSASATTTITTSGEPRIDIYSPADGQVIKRAPNTPVILTYEINNFVVGQNGNTFSLSLDGSTTIYTEKRPISLGELANGAHTMTLSLLTQGNTTPILTKTVAFTVDLAAPTVVISYPRAGDVISCHRGELIAARVKITHWALGENGKSVQLLLNGLPFGAAMTSLSALETLSLCDLALDTTHELSVVLRDGTGTERASSNPITFEPRKAIPKVTLRQPVDGNVDLARGGFTLIYEFARGYDSMQLAVLLNGSPLAGPIPTTLGTNAVALPAALLRDGANDLLITVTTEGLEVQTAFARFSTQVAATPPKSKGGAFGPWVLLLLALALLGFRLRIALK